MKHLGLFLHIVSRESLCGRWAKCSFCMACIFLKWSDHALSWYKGSGIPSVQCKCCVSGLLGDAGLQKDPYMAPTPPSHTLRRSIHKPRLTSSGQYLGTEWGYCTKAHMILLAHVPR